MIQTASGVARPTVWRPGWWPAPAAVAFAIPLLLLLTLVTPWPRLFAFFVLAWWLPGLALALLWRLPDADWVDVGLTALGLGLGWLMVGALLLHYLPGPLALNHLLALYGGGALLLAVALALHPPVAPRSVDRSTLYWGLALLALTCLLRLPGLGYHEFHADEVVLLRQGGRAIRGEDDALARHTKGPGEIAIATVAYRATGTTDEAMARLPFALMSVGSVLATAWLGRWLFGGRIGQGAGGWAGVLLAVNGFALGLSRIAQYQAAMLLLSSLAVLAGWRFAQRGEARWLALAGMLSGTGLLLHYEFGLLALALVLLLWVGWRRSAQPQTVAKTVAVTGIAGALLLAAAYVPALLNPYFETTQGYLANRLGQVGAFNLPFFVEMGTFYNATYFFAGLVVLMLIGTALGWRRARLQTVVLTLWWLPFLIVYLFVVRFPGTHFYLLMESWSLLAALPLAVVMASRKRAVKMSALALVVLWLAVSVYYLYLLFFRQQPEYLVNPNRTTDDRWASTFYWAPFSVPEKPRFGFPIYEGWQTVGVLGKWGYLGETYAANDDAWSLRRWYLTPFSKRDFAEQPDVIFVAHHLQEPNPEFDDEYLDAYHRAGEVRVRGEPRLELWTKRPLPVPYVTFDAEHFAPLFRSDVAALAPATEGSPLVQNEPLGETLTLASAHLATTRPARGDTLHLRLAWLPSAPLPLDYKLFVHVAGADGRPVAQWDGLPGLNTARTSQWPVGETFQDHVLLTIPPTTPPGDYTLLVGLYDPATGDRLGDRAIPLTQLTVR
jgi:4-amino-4-deoxy-L-arabinose transferase-like glycosyltransferase